MSFPGGLAGSASKAGSRYKFLIASTFAEFCPTLREKLGAQSRVPANVASIMEIVINGRDLATVADATLSGDRCGGRNFRASWKITAGN